MKLAEIKEYLIRVIAPNRCVFCNKVIDYRENACEKCYLDMPNEYIVCLTKGDFHCVASFPYTGCYRNALLTMKFNNRPYYAKSMAKFMSDDIMQFYGNIIFDIITSVPLHKNQLKERGYNQSELLAREISMLNNISYKETIIKYRDNHRQHTLSNKARISNVRKTYKLISKDFIKGKKILLIDDVITTGCTLGECAKILQSGGAAKVCTATFCSVDKL